MLNKSVLTFLCRHLMDTNQVLLALCCGRVFSLASTRQLACTSRAMRLVGRIKHVQGANLASASKLTLVGYANVIFDSSRLLTASSLANVSQQGNTPLAKTEAN